MKVVICRSCPSSFLNMPKYLQSFWTSYHHQPIREIEQYFVLPKSWDLVLQLTFFYVLNWLWVFLAIIIYLFARLNTTTDRLHVTISTNMRLCSPLYYIDFILNIELVLIKLNINADMFIIEPPVSKPQSRCKNQLQCKWFILVSNSTDNIILCNSIGIWSKWPYMQNAGRHR